MTQDQYGQARGPGYVVRGDAVPDDETEGYPGEEATPKTRFQKVASAILGDKADRDEAARDEEGRDQPISGEAPAQGDYWEEPGTTEAERDEAVAVTRPDGMDHPATEPDMFGSTARAGNGSTPEPYAETQPGAATIADVPASGTRATDVPASGTRATDVPAAGTAGRHAADPAASEMRPGEATGGLGDFSDLTYGNLIPDAGQYSAQWQQIQFRFVDDPQASVTEAADIIAQVTAKMEAAIQERQRAIEERQHAIAEQQRTLRGRWGDGANADTETLRETLRMYKTFLDQLIGSRAG
jgi:hypothetical protein